jgi:hypothetical protein
MLRCCGVPGQHGTTTEVGKTVPSGATTCEPGRMGEASRAVTGFPPESRSRRAPQWANRIVGRDPREFAHPGDRLG